MTTWTSNELNKIGNAEELQIASLRRDGTLRKLVTIWVVRLGDDLYVRSVNGRSSSWFSGVQTRYEGRIRAGGVEKDVTFVDESDYSINDQIDVLMQKSIVFIPVSPSLWRPLLCEPQPSKLCRAQQTLSSTFTVKKGKKYE